jgi:hypothetical protein
LCHCQFKNGQLNYAATDSEITSQNSVVDDSEINSNGGVIPTYFFFLVFTVTIQTFGCHVIKVL